VFVHDLLMTDESLVSEDHKGIEGFHQPASRQGWGCLVLDGT